MNDTRIGRRGMVAGLASVSLGATTAVAAPGIKITIAAQSPWLCNAVAVSEDGSLILGLPRFEGHGNTPSLAKVDATGQVKPFPGNSWNDWHQGSNGRDAFVMVNSVHIFSDDTVWVVDQGAPPGAKPLPGVQKLVRLDVTTGDVLTVIRFDNDILPPGAQMNDLRIHDNMVYVTDSGLGGIIVHDLTTGGTLRRLSAHPLLCQIAGMPLRGQGGRELADGSGKYPLVQSDILELSSDGAWLYFAPPTGPLRRVPTALLTDPRLPDVTVAAGIEKVADLPTIGGTVMDDLGNIFIAEAESRSVQMLKADGTRVVLARDERLISPDAMFIDNSRTLYTPAPQIEYLAPHNGGQDKTHAPFFIYAIPLPAELAGETLGKAVMGCQQGVGLSNFHGIEHIAMTVPDHDAAVKFLQRAFDVSVLYSLVKKGDDPLSASQVGRLNGLSPGTAMRAVSQLRFASGPNIEIFELEGINRSESANMNDLGIVHFSVLVEDLEKATTKFENAGGILLVGPNNLGGQEKGPGNQNRFGRMPWGSWVEFMTFRSPLRYDPGAVAQRWFPKRA